MDPLTIFAALNTATQLLDLADKWRAQLQRTGEWTPEQEAEYQAMTEKAFASPAWKQN